MKSDFYNTAFSNLQKTNIKTTELNNDCYSTLMGKDGFSELNAPSTSDKVFLLSHDDLCNAKYGFEYTGNWMDESHALIGTDYAYCQGLTVRGGNTNRVGDRICWWTRTPSGTRGAINIHGRNYVEGISYAYRTDNGVCPAISLYELKSDVEIDYEQISELDWSISDDGILTIAGNGAMPNYQDIQKVPWYKVREQIKSVVIEEGITKIGRMSFAHCTNMTQISIPLSVKTIESMAFKDSDALKDVYYSGSFDDWCNENIIVIIDSYNNPLFDASYHFQKPHNENPVDINFFNSGKTSVVFKNSWFEHNNNEYNHELAQFCANYSMLGYCDTEAEIKTYLEKVGFIVEDGDACKHTGRDEINYFIAQKTVLVNSKLKKLIFVGTIGSYKDQWYSDFDPQSTQPAFWDGRDGAPYYNDKKDHMGFGDGMEYIYKKLRDYEMNKCNWPTEDIIILSTGHSRGAAISNMLAARLIDEAIAEKRDRLADVNNIYAYTFATPNVTKKVNEKGYNAQKYNAIHNIVNPEDFVTNVLLEQWGYGRYGYTYVLPSWSNTNGTTYNQELTAMRKKFKEYTGGKTYYPYNLGMTSTMSTIALLGGSVRSINDFYSSYFFTDLAGGLSETPYTFFKNVVCKLLAGSAEEKVVAGVRAANIVGTSVSLLYREILLYFLDLDVIDTEKGVHFSIDFANAHQMETYCAYMTTLSAQRLLKEKKPKLNLVKCPVDIEVYDRISGDLVGKITNNTVDETIAAKNNAIVMTVDGDQKLFWLPDDGDYQVILTGNGNGTMNYSVLDVDSATGKSERINFFDVEVRKGVSITGDFSNELTNLNEYSLTMADGTKLTPTESTSESSNEYKINVVIDGQGYASESKTATSGDYVSFDAAEADDSAFVGWYEDGKLIERDTSLSFVVKKNRNLVAKFQDVMSAAQLNIKPTTTVDYRSRVTVVASASYVPNGYYVALYDGSKQLAKGDNKTVRYKVGEMRANKTLTVKLIDASGNVQKDSKGKDLSENIEIKVNAGFFKKLAAFFKGMFGLLPNVEIKPGIEAKEAVYTLSYDANGGSVAPTKQNGFGKVTISNTQPTRNGYSFLGWGLTATTSNVLYKPGATITLATNTILYAVWKQDDYILTYHANGGENAPKKQAGNGTITLSTKTPTRDGYVFTGWATSSIASSSQYSAGSSYILSKNTTLYAVWIIKGDINMDGEINLVDLTRLRFFLAGTVELTKIQQDIADLNNDGTIDDADLTLMRQLLVGITS